MSDNLKVEASFVEALIQDAAWDAAKVDISEGRKAVKEKKVKEQDDEEEVPAEEAKKVKEASKKVKEQDDDEDSDEMKEGVEVHTCPLCESTLEEELSDDKIREHVAQIQAALQSIDEFNGDDEDDAVDAHDDPEADAAAGESDPDAEADAKADMDEKKKKKKAKKESVMKKVKELKKASKGK